MAGFWQGVAVDPSDPTGISNYYGANGKNVASIIGGKLHVYDPSQFNAADPDVQSVLTTLKPQMATPQETSNIINEDAPGNGAGKGSMKEGLTDAALFMATMGAGSALAGGAMAGAGEAGAAGSGAGGWFGAGPGIQVAGDVGAGGLGSASTWGSGLGSGAVGGSVVPGAAGATGGAAGGLLGGITGGQALSGLGALSALAGGGGGGGTDMTGFMGNGPSFDAPTGSIPGIGSLDIPNYGGSILDQFPSPTGTDPFSTGITGSLASNPSLIARLAQALGTDSSTLLKTLGSAAPGLLGALASNSQTSALTGLAQKYMDMGAPYRTQLQGLMANPSSFLASDEVQKPVQMGTDSLMRSLSTQGNPWGSGNALQQGQNYATNGLYSALQSKENQLGNLGGLGTFNAAAPAAQTAAIGSQTNMLNSLGSAAGSVFNPQPTMAQSLAGLKGLFGAT